jgi:hypothetical protein
MLHQSQDYFMLEDFIRLGVVAIYHTKSDAQKCATLIGLKPTDILRVERRFEFLWVVGTSKIDTISKYISFLSLSIYTGFWDFDMKGTFAPNFTEVRKPLPVPHAHPTCKKDTLYGR